jgi:predicted NAD-dependent protein-ADP-ribosyltransferase YbiA (DUF1768 family)
MDNTKNIQKAILFCNPLDIRTGFLSNESKHGFILEDKRWMTVEHYIQAKKFEGTHYEEEIRLSPTVFQVKRLTKVKDEIFIGDNGKLNRRPVYGRNGEYRIRKDWSIEIQNRFLEEGVRAKFTQNKYLSKRLIDTRTSKLLDEKNKLIGPILEKIRKELTKNNIESSFRKTNSPSLFQSDKIKDLKFHKLPPQEKNFVIGIITIAKRISVMEGWDKIFKEMVEDVVYMLTSNKSEIKDIFDYINFFYKIDWTNLYRDMPNTYEIIHEIQEIFKETDKSQGSQKSITIVSILIWVTMAATKEQKKDIYSKIKKCKTLHISIPKVQRLYRQQKPPLPIKKSKSKIKTPLSTNTPLLLTLSEKKIIDELFEEKDCNGELADLKISELQKIVKKKMRKIPTIDQKELKKYVSNTYKEINGLEIEKPEIEKHFSVNVLSLKEKKLISKVLRKYKLRIKNITDKPLFISKKLRKLVPDIKMKDDFEKYISEQYIKINKDGIENTDIKHTSLPKEKINTSYSVEEPVIEIPKKIEPVIEIPVIEIPVIEIPVIEIPVIEIPVIEIPVIEIPVIEIPKKIEPVIEIPVIEIPKKIEPVIEIPVIEIPKKVEPITVTVEPIIEVPKKIEPFGVTEEFKKDSNISDKEDKDYLKYTLSEDPIEGMSDYETQDTYGSDSDEEGGSLPPEIKKAILYLEIFGPLKLPKEIYSNVIEKLNNLSEDKSMFYINRWNELSTSDRTHEIDNFLKS